MSLHMDENARRKDLRSWLTASSPPGDPGGDWKRCRSHRADRRTDPARRNFGALSAAVRGLRGRQRFRRRNVQSKQATTLDHAWGAALSKGVPPQSRRRLKRDMASHGGRRSRIGVRAFGALRRPERVALGCCTAM